MMKTVKMVVNGKTQYYDVYDDRVLGRGGKVIAELGDFKRKPTKENYLLTDQEHWYRFFKFIPTGPTFEPNGIAVKCLRVEGGTVQRILVDKSPFWPDDKEWFYWHSLSEFQ